ncbi:uncharacterized protein LOC106658854 [Trichogramma pretiosum]|uniref:Uncharacterized protein n=1 Tax=Trichogramma kaykai TaxID=54128 RepID=A0ABD2VYW5_9HYME|nr:uncharacterized protein LOC106658854 [Trichogramma pretiosum]
MQLSRIFCIFSCYFLVLTCVASAPQNNEPFFELPVQLVGFPVIIAAVRISNFVKKLAYSLNPQTYQSRVKRGLIAFEDEEQFDVPLIEKKLIEEAGQNVCIYERVCAKYAETSLQKSNSQHHLDWNVIFSQYKSSPDPMKDNYLLSVFLGDIIGSPRLCRLLAKRGRQCQIPLID